MLTAVVVLWLAAPARAGEVTVSDLAGGGFLQYADSAGVADTLRIFSAEERVIQVIGPTVTAGPGCVAIAGGASCTRPPSTVAWERSSIATEGGDDVVLVEAPQPMRIFGGEGNDTITFNAGTAGGLYGMDGDDVLSSAGKATLEGGPGNDRLTAGAASGLSGGPGTDSLDGSPQNDVLVDAGDGGTRDVIACRGGTDVIQGDPGDVIESCPRSALDEISKVKYRWRAYFATGLTASLRLRVRDTNYAGVQSPFARCLGAACRGARFDDPRDDGNFRVSAGGVRFKVGGRTRRGLRPGARVRAGLEFTFGDVTFTKGLEFRTRDGKLPRVTKRCTVTVPPLTGRTVTVPCT